MSARLRRDRLTLQQRASTLSYVLENRGKFGLYFKTDDLLYYNEDNVGAEKQLTGSLDVSDQDGVVDVNVAYPLRISNQLLRNLGSDVIEVAAVPGADVRKWFALLATNSGVGAGYGVMGIGTPTQDGTAPTPGFDAECFYLSHTSTAVAGNPAGIRAAAVNHFRAQHDPFLAFRIKPVTNTNIRYWIGAFSAAPGNVATLGAVQAFGLSWFNTDTNWQLVTSNGTTTTFTDTGVAFAANADLIIRCWLYGTTAYAQINNNAIVSATATLPAAATELSYFVRNVTTAAAAPVIKIASVWADFN